MDKSPFDLSHQNQNIESKIIAALERISQSFRALLWKESVDRHLTPIQIQVLIFLLYHPEENRKVTYLASEFNMTKATISDTVKTLENKQLISKDYEPHDTRSYIIHLTAKGKQIADQAALFIKPLQTPIEKLSEVEKENLLLSLFSIILHLTKTDTISIQRMCFTCTYYSKDEKGHEHFCKLLDQNLYRTDLRVDCPEHKSV